MVNIFNFLIFLIKFYLARCDDYQGVDAYIGCFIDNRLARDLNKLPGQIGNVWIGSNQNMTVDSCLNLCRNFSLPYAGLEFANECYCGDTYGRYGQVSNSECNYKCVGNANQICGGADRLSVYSVRILSRSELVVVLNASQYSFTTTRIAQASVSNSISWIDYLKTGFINVYVNNNNVPIQLNANRPDLKANQYYIFLSLRGNQLATFYNCLITDAVMLNDSTITTTFLSANTIAVFGQVIFNTNLNDIFQMYGCVNYNDAYQQIFSQANDLVKGYCKLTLNDMQDVNNQISDTIQNITQNRNSINDFLTLIGNNLAYCTSKKC